MVENTVRPILLDLTLEQLGAALKQAGQPAYRAKQVYHWLHRRGVIDPAAMTDLPAALRTALAEQFTTWPLLLKATQVSRDGSVKFGWLTPAGAPVEAVLMPGFNYGSAVCVSSQSGCSLGCGFCQTGRLGLREQLSAGMILAQLYLAEAHHGAAVDRLVLMGMGEPLLNLGAVRRVVEMLTAAEGRDWSPRRITVSTVGLVKPLVTLAREFPRVNLALSLHFTTAEKRQRHMPRAEADPERLAEVLHFYRLINGGKITLEYALMDGLNDRERDARRLARFARLAGLDEENELVREANEAPEPARLQPLPLHVNLIAYNPVPAAREYQPSPESRVNEFATLLKDSGIPVTVRHSRGTDISAACGQLGTELGNGEAV
ncbi:23S rRNA (adenine(2503)-C(2))-methyltransferase RlmN [bacterium]|nr:23S rRNA (adenine(2503)-C(2))-methyltransferase RlmN [bacterium]